MEISLRNDSLTFTLKPTSAWAYFLFIEKSQTPGDTASPRAVGARLAQAWFFTQCYDLNGEELVDQKLTELNLTLKEANKLLVPLTQVAAQVEILDDAESLEESKHLMVNNSEFTISPIPWEAADRWLSDVRVSVAQAYKNMIKSYVRRDAERITDAMLSDPETLGLEEGKVLFELVKYAVN